MALICHSLVNAEEIERVTNYEYDASGNIIRVTTQEQSQPPVFSTISPNFINIGSSIKFNIDGENFINAEVSTQVDGLIISEVEAGVSGVSFILTANENAVVGDANITSTTRFGAVDFNISVAGKLPKLYTDPSPITFVQTDVDKDLVLTFSEPRPSNETYTVTIDDAGVATTSISSFEILEGQSVITIPIKPHTLGATAIRISLDGQFFFFDYPLYVNSSFDSYALLEPSIKDDNNLFSNRVGVLLLSDDTSDHNVISQSVGVLMLSGDTSDHNVVSQSVGVLMLSSGTSDHNVISQSIGVLMLSNGTSDHNVISQSVGVLVGTIGQALTLSPMVEVIVGALIDSYSPENIGEGSQEIIVSGSNLQDVSDVIILPADDITVDSFSSNETGQQLTVNLTVNAGAVLGERTLEITSSDTLVQDRQGLDVTLNIQ